MSNTCKDCGLSTKETYLFLQDEGGWRCRACNKNCNLNYSLSEKEMVHSPSHYQSEKYEVIDIIEDFRLGFNLGNALKYILRAGKKDDYKKDLEKAIWYLSREIYK